ncbi:formate dehydrogenase accessory sulfurtransferase FdhD [Billgrantia diversa]|uniref:formate dehydrogenase accessory sulfurtransferase FdhD n=1 Tax=Halomonas sp. MCCC 1A13316 TaxID=2733487 RepID=UPI0018A653E5|nr:formate dehydrogenase accessory sulfurtransferase FdhD [Halomonas sp. MCCC 1A13316]QOR40586.1 formate dehydrogenase accessory sulfurtransferase FdhD [Halomonas sp. MCCC 1A13316]
MSDDQSRCQAPVDVRRGSSAERLKDSIAVETPVALVYNGISHAVMMATPAELEDFALGFSFTEGILEASEELYGIEVLEETAGIAVHLDIATQRFMELKQRRRSLAGRTGCGLCGTESLEQAIRPVVSVTAPRVEDAAIQHALDALKWHQPLQRETGATHGAAWCDLDGQVLLAREDVGRHNALDKLIGAMLKRRFDPHHGFALVSSRASYEMVQKCASAGIGCLVAVSASTSLAIELARQAGLKLVGFARPGRHVIYHQPAVETAPAAHASGG